jgi:hypothetical protein
MPRPSLVRSGSPPDDLVVVVRGGERSLDDALLERSLSDCWDAHGFFGLSVFADSNGDGLRELARSTPLVRRRVLRLAVVGRLRETGFEVVATFTNQRHFSVVVPDASRETFAFLRACFGPPVANPGYEPG